MIIEAWILTLLVVPLKAAWDTIAARAMATEAPELEDSARRVLTP